MEAKTEGFDPLNPGLAYPPLVASTTPGFAAYPPPAALPGTEYTPGAWYPPAGTWVTDEVTGDPEPEALVSIWAVVDATAGAARGNGEPAESAGFIPEAPTELLITPVGSGGLTCATGDGEARLLATGAVDIAPDATADDVVDAGLTAG
mmetsp:Transcript_8731/g.13714  ORF Transcript_8731/g.13714 Transcript_8731/m.13714 type:complete len:149 (-) Transcript_8731:210-656(-)